MQARVESFYDPATSTFTHVVYECDGGHAAIVDPVLDFDPSIARTSTQSADRVLNFLREHHLVADWVLETHAQADHLTAASYLKMKTGARVAIGRGIGGSLSVEISPGRALVNVIPEGALGCVERVAKRDVDVSVRRMFCVLAAHAYSAAGYDEIDLDVVRCALAAVSRRRVNDNMASGDTVVKPLEMFDELANPCLHCRRRIEMPEGQLQWRLHIVCRSRPEVRATTDIDAAASHTRKANIAPWLP
jgi:hypothetical protein